MTTRAFLAKRQSETQAPPPGAPVPDILDIMDSANGFTPASIGPVHEERGALVLPIPVYGYASTMLAYLAQQGQRDHIEGIFRAIKESTGSRGVLRHTFFKDLLVPCWRFAAGRGAYFGPVPVIRIGRELEGYALTPGSIWLPREADCASWERATIEEVWPRWDKECQSVYADVRAAAVELSERWFVENGHEAELAKGLEVRLVCARYAANAVQSFRSWRADALDDQKGGKS